MYAVALLASTATFLSGYETSILLDASTRSLRQQFGLAKIEYELLLTLSILLSWIFSIGSGIMSTKYGRKRIILAGSAILAVGEIVMATATNTVSQKFSFDAIKIWHPSIHPYLILNFNA